MNDEKKTKKKPPDSIFNSASTVKSSHRQDLVFEKGKKKRAQAGRTSSSRITTTNERRQQLLLGQKMRDTNGLPKKTSLHKVTAWNELVCSVRMAHLVRIWFWEPLHTTSPPASLYLIQPAGAA